jgi:hypothetical protein
MTGIRKRCSVDECDNKFYARDFCKLHYRRYIKHGDPHVVFVSHHAHQSKVHLMKERFETKFVKKDDDQCWKWLGVKSKDGYGAFNLHIGNKVYRKVRSHRLSYEFYKGEIPSGMLVCHKCDNRECINPEHLFLGTQKDNLLDMRRKGRSLHGHKNPKSKFSQEQLAIIRSELLSAELSMQKLANKYGVNLCTIKRIKYNKSYQKKGSYDN